MSDIEEKEFLKNYDITVYKRPSITVDIAAFAVKSDIAETYRHDAEPSLAVLLVKRPDHPYKGMLSLPGGFLQENEDFNDCAVKNIINKTAVSPTSLMPLGHYSNPNRDPRGWIVSNAFLSILNELPADIADNAEWFEIKYHIATNRNLHIKLVGQDDTIAIIGEYVNTTFGLPVYKTTCKNLAFDHDQILIDALARMLTIADDMSILLDFMPEKFTLASIQRVTEVITNKPVAAANFRRKIAPYITETDEFSSGMGHRPAKLFTRNLNI